MSPRVIRRSAVADDDFGYLIIGYGLSEAGGWANKNKGEK